MARRPDSAQYLFSEYDLHRVCENQRQQMKGAIDRADAGSIASGDVDDLARAYAGQFALDVPELAEGATSG
jgi:hypothetical protein